MSGRALLWLPSDAAAFDEEYIDDEIEFLAMASKPCALSILLKGREGLTALQWAEWMEEIVPFLPAVTSSRKGDA